MLEEYSDTEKNLLQVFPVLPLISRQELWPGSLVQGTCLLQKLTQILIMILVLINIVFTLLSYVTGKFAGKVLGRILIFF